MSLAIQWRLSSQIFSIALIGGVLSPFDTVIASEQPPNIVVIMVDDLGFGDISPYGQQLIQTPRLQEMASQSLVLTQFYSGDSWCPVARNSLMTGLHAGHTQLTGLGPIEEDSAAAPLYLPRYLAEQGYRTAMFGKWGLGRYELGADRAATATHGRPSEVGFDEFLGQLTHRDAHTHTLPPFPLEPGDQPIHSTLWKIESGTTVEESMLPVPFIPERILDATLEFIRGNRDVPFFLYLPWALPHAEYFVSPEDPSWEPYLDESGKSVFPETPFPGNPVFRRPVPNPKAAYAAMVSRLDSDIGRILDSLTELDLTRRTLIVFTSDNGPAADGGFENPDFFESTAGLRGFKRSLYEGGIRVPLLVSWRGTIPPRTSRLPMSLWDLFATLLDLAGHPALPDRDGLSMLSMFLGDDHTQPRHDENTPLYWETTNHVFHSQAARLGEWKAVRPVIERPGDRVELYHLGLDPGETEDLSEMGSTCDLLSSLKNVMNNSHDPPPGGGRPPVPPLDLRCPAVFSNGFESGDASAWTNSVGR